MRNETVARPKIRQKLRFAIAALLLAFSAKTSVADPPADNAGNPTGPSAEAIEFFERDVRPLLVNKCVECHDSETQEAGLRLDSGVEALKGSASGAVIVPGKPEESPLIAAIGYKGQVQMPPEGKLKDDEIAILVRWVQLGAPWPAEEQPPTAEVKHAEPSDAYAEIRSKHWAFQPIQHPKLPVVQDKAWVQKPIDLFVLAQLEAADLEPAPPASRRVLLRRLYFDLIGLPPTMEDISNFDSSNDPQALEKVVDRLLGSSQHGEHWARAWLDVARYADTKGYVFTAEPRYPFAYTYRDYVIRAFNEDLPYDQFVLNQLAADKIVDAEDPKPLAALGFLTLGRRFDNNIHDIIDDRIDVVSRALLGLSVSCARCHDHKYDPIPTADYYSLYGVFASSTEPGEQPLIATPAENQAYAAYMGELKNREGQLNAFVDDHWSRVKDELRSHVSDYLVRLVSDNPEQAVKDGTFVSLSPGEIKPQVVKRWRGFVKQKVGADHPVFGPWVALAALPPETFATQAAEYCAALGSADSESTQPPVNVLVADILKQASPTSMTDVALRYGQLFENVYSQWQQARSAYNEAVAAGQATGDPPSQLEDAAAEELRQLLFADGTPTSIERDRLGDYIDREASGRLRELKNQVESWQASSPDTPARAMALVDAGTPVEPQIFLRGNPHQKGETVPRRFLSALAGEQAPPFANGSGRLELARSIVDSANPLTARVIVNRVWQHHMGHGIVRTPSDFGTRGERPTHPELLDWLASEFMANGWSLKWLHREIVLSAVYQQSSEPSPKAVAVDTENRLLSHANRQRLEFEAFRDATLSVAGRLDRKATGHAVELFSEPFTTRRSVYGFIDRQDLPGVLRVFDFASPDASTEERVRTIVPQQSLFLLNSPFIIEQARYLAARSSGRAALDESARIQRLYQLTFGRNADEDELAMALEFVQSGDHEGDDETSLHAWHRLAQALLMTNEFVFID